MLELKDIQVSIGSASILKPMSFTCKAHEILSILGPSGSGKTTVLKALSGLVPVSGGQIFLNGKDITECSPEQRGIGYVAQDPTLFSHLTVEENIRFGLDIRKIDSAEKMRRVHELMEVLELDGLAQRKPHQISGGQRQRTAIGRALAIRPEVLLLDEPFSSLDQSLRASMGDLIRKLKGVYETAIVLVTHDRFEAMSLSEYLVLLLNGAVLQKGTPECVYRRPETPEAAAMLGPYSLYPESMLCSTEASSGRRFFARPGDLLLIPDPNGSQIVSVERRGLEIHYQLEHDGHLTDILSTDLLPLGCEKRVRPVWVGESLWFQMW